MGVIYSSVEESPVFVISTVATMNFESAVSRLSLLRLPLAGEYRS